MFDFEPNDVTELPATGGREQVIDIGYDTGDESRVVAAGGELYQGVVYILLARGELISIQQRLSQLAIIDTGFTINALEQEDLVGVEPLRLTDDLLAEFEAYIVDAMERFNVPGAAVAVVQKDEIVYANGFGVRELGKDDLVTPETLMMIGSITKSMTTMLIGYPGRRWFDGLGYTGRRGLTHVCSRRSGADPTNHLAQPGVRLHRRPPAGPGVFPKF